MNEVYAVLLLHESKKEINEENIKRVLSAVGVEIDENRIKALLKAIEGINIDEIINQAIIIQNQPTSQQTQEKKEEEKKKEEEAVAGLASLFG
ncbi:MAG: 50S ribosomal protein L12 [Candidatus Aenigmatarchaeota archaeon]